jgi:hypothetical protein
MSDFGCTGKVAYRLRADAVKAKKQQRHPGDSKAKARTLHIYFCTYCKQYHLSSIKESREKMDEVRQERETDAMWRMLTDEDESP